MQLSLLGQWLVALLGFSVWAVSTLPIIIILGLCAGRRGNAAFLLAGNYQLLRGCLILSISGFIYFPASYALLLLPYANPDASFWGPFFQLPGLPWLTSLCAWAAGVFALYLAGAFWPAKAPADNRYALGFVSSPLWFLLFAAFFFFATFCLINWPFSGLPADVSLEKALMAIFRNGFRHYFMAFAPAGAFGLCLVACSTWSGKKLSTAWRWLAAWATAGYIPYLLTAWSLTIGAALNTGAKVGGLTPVMSISLLSLAVLCWIVALLVKKPLFFLAWLGVFLLVLSESWPFIARLFINAPMQG